MIPDLVIRYKNQHLIFLSLGNWSSYIHNFFVELRPPTYKLNIPMLFLLSDQLFLTVIGTTNNNTMVFSAVMQCQRGINTVSIGFTIFTGGRGSLNRLLLLNVFLMST